MKRVWLAIGVSLLAACAGEGEGEDAFADDAPEQAIRGGATGGGHAALDLGNCTAVAIGPRMALTASHCFGRLGTVASGQLGIRVQGTNDGTNWFCLNGAANNTDGKCVRNSVLQIDRMTTNDLDEANDIAVITSATPWNTQSVFASVSTRSPRVGEVYTQWGSSYGHWDGSGGGIMRFMNNTIDWVGAEHIVTDAGNVRSCYGDSGGPLMYSNDRVFAIHVQASEHSSECAKVGSKQRATILNQRKVDFINQVRQRELGSPCSVLANGDLSC